MLSPGARDRGPPPRHSLLVSGGSSIRCFLSTPFAVLTFVLVTIFFFYLLWTPIFAPIGIAHGLRIDLPKAEVRVQPADRGVIVELVTMLSA